MEDLKSMKKTRFIPMLLASQLVLGSSLNFTPNAKAGVISTTVEHTIDVLGTAVKCLIIGVTVIGTTVVVAEIATAVCKENLCEHAFTPFALQNAGITIENVRDYNENRKSQNYKPFHMWCADKGVTSTHIPGVYEYEDCYYFLVGNQGIKLSAVKEDAIAKATVIWNKVEEQSKVVWDKAVQFCKAGFSAVN